MKFLSVLFLSLVFLAGCMATSPEIINEDVSQPLVAPLEIPVQMTLPEHTKIYTMPIELEGKILMTNRVSIEATVTYETTRHFEEQFGPNHWIYVVFPDKQTGWIRKSVLINQ